MSETDIIVRELVREEPPYFLTSTAVGLVDNETFSSARFAVH